MSTSVKAAFYCFTCLFFLFPISSHADEGGVSFWIPGQVGSFAATLLESGWSLPLTYYHTWADANGSKSFQYDTKVTAGLEANADLLFLSPTYVFKDLLWNGQLALAITVAVGQSDVSANADLTFPGNTLTSKRSDLGTGMSDIFPEFSLRWNDGVDNYMVYGSFNIPVGVYDADKLANIGLGHFAIDIGGAYTYCEPKDGNEFSANLGFTVNFENTHTDYQNGLDAHLDIAASHFFSATFLAGAVGYYYQQVTDDMGSGVLIDSFRSSVIGIGPQLGYFFPVEGKKWFSSLKGYYEVAATDRPEGWNLSLTLAIPL